MLIDGLVLDALALLDALTSTDTDQVTAEPTKDAPSDGRGADGQGEADEAGQALALLALLPRNLGPARDKRAVPAPASDRSASDCGGNHLATAARVFN